MHYDERKYNSVEVLFLLEIKEVKRRKERAKELEGIDTSNIVVGSRRRSTFSFVPPPKPKEPIESDGDDSQDSENENNDGDGSEDTDNEDDNDNDNDNEDADDDQDNVKATQSEEVHQGMYDMTVSFLLSFFYLCISVRCICIFSCGLALDL